MSNSCGGVIEYDGRNIDVPPLAWHKKPAVFGGNVYRRIEGENVISGKWARSVFALDAHEYSRDDFPASSALNQDDVDSFREAVISRNTGYEHFSRDEFMRRTGIYSGRHMTFAGALMFGEILDLRAELRHNDVNAAAGARNIWSAYIDLMPKLTQKLSPQSSALFKKAIINALLHSDYNIDTHINIAITSSPARAVIDNPGIIRGITRNYRLKRMFDLAGIHHTHNQVLILKQDMLNFRTSTTIMLEGMPEAFML